MRKIKIVADSAADVLEFANTDYSCVPMKILTAEREFVDDATLDVAEMVAYFNQYKGKSSTSCPNVSDWLEAFGDADEVFCVTITSRLSGSYNAAMMAKQMYESEHPQRRVFVIDTRTAGPEMKLVIEKLAEYIEGGLMFEEICTKVQAYLETTGLHFMLKSLKNLANNGRVSPVTAKIAGLIGICLVGKASDGVLEPLGNCRGEKRALEQLVQRLKDCGVQKGKVYIAHCNNAAAAQKIKAALEAFDAEVKISACRGLCSFYAEQGGILIGYERG